MNKKTRNRIYFASDFHLGTDANFSSKEREMKLVNWLDGISEDAMEIYFLGDIFDHWFEYMSVIPKGFSLFLGKIAELRQKDIPIYFFTGNHDMWMLNYFKEEYGIPIIREGIKKNILGKEFYLAHGDGLPNESISNKFMKLMFSSKFLQWMFARLHPNFALSLMKYFSRRSRLSHEQYDRNFDLSKEKMINFAEGFIEKNDSLDFIIMGHRHLPIDLTLKNKKSRYINLGDWISHFSYAVYDGKTLKIQFFEDEQTIYPI